MKLNERKDLVEIQAEMLKWCEEGIEFMLFFKSHCIATLCEYDRTDKGGNVLSFGLGGAAVAKTT